MYSVMGITGGYVTKGSDRAKRLTARCEQLEEIQKEADPGDVQEEDENKKGQQEMESKAGITKDTE